MAHTDWTPPVFAPLTVTQGKFTISTDTARLDEDVMFDFLVNESYWSQDLTREKLHRALQFSLCFGVYEGDRQIGFARVITDYTKHAYIADVFILRPYRGQGLSKWLMACILAHPELQTVRKWNLNTRDAHELYRRFGFENDPRPENYLIYRPEMGSAQPAAPRTER